MSEQSFTPGPWMYSGSICDVNTSRLYCGGVYPVEVKGSDYRGPVATIQSCDHIKGISQAEAEANARLIAASPKLLLMLNRMTIHLQLSGYSPVADSNNPAESLLHDALELIDEATQPKALRGDNDNGARR